MATLPTPIKRPAETPSRIPLRPWLRPREPCSKRYAPIATAPPSNAISPAREYAEWACDASAVTASSARPPALSPRPVHSRQPSSMRNQICAGIASSTRPPAITACTNESGASDIAAT